MAYSVIGERQKAIEVCEEWVGTTRTIRGRVTRWRPTPAERAGARI